MKFRGKQGANLIYIIISVLIYGTVKFTGKHYYFSQILAGSICKKAITAAGYRFCLSILYFSFV